LPKKPPKAVSARWAGPGLVLTFRKSLTEQKPKKKCKPVTALKSKRGVKFYMHPRHLIADEIKDFISIKENLVFEENVIRYGCNTFASTNLDFIDCLLIAYANVKGNPVFTFDNDLNKQLKQNAFNHG
jgi:predicted nucleic acid-binding protein